MSWFNPPAVPAPIEQRVAARGVVAVDDWQSCDACKRVRWPGELETANRSDTLLVICKDPGPCIIAAKVAQLWMI